MKATTAVLEAIQRLQAEGRIIERHQGPAPAVETISEKDFMAAILELAKRHAWKCYHAFDSRRSEPGWPDLFLARGSVALACELKTDDGRLTAAQSSWLEALDGVTVSAHCFRLADWPAIEAALTVAQIPADSRAGKI